MGLMDTYADTALEYGTSWVDIILAVANAITGGNAAPGVVSLVLLLVLVVLGFWYWMTTHRFRKAVGDTRKVLETDRQPGETGEITKSRLLRIDHRFGEKRTSMRSSSPSSRLATAWFEFRETTLPPRTDTELLRNTVRPSEFFSPEELGLEHGLWRQVPALFVSVGLLLTFLGLVAALDRTGEVLEASGSGAATDGLKALLRVASAKFIMSLTGLLCSILFTLWQRRCGMWTQRALHELCIDIEKCCKYVSDQDGTRELLEEAREQTTQLKSFSTELVAQIAKPLREDLPDTIRESIREAVEPAMKRVSESTGQGFGTLADTVSTQLASGMKAAVGEMNDAVTKVGDTLREVAGELGSSSGQMTGHVDSAVKSLAEQIGTLEAAMHDSSKDAVRALNQGADTLLQRMDDSLTAIRTNTGEGVEKLSAASIAMAETATSLSESIQQSAREAATESSVEIKQAGVALGAGIDNATEAMRRGLLDPMQSLVDQIEGLAAQMREAATQVGGYASATENGTHAVSAANAELRQSAATLSDATSPVRHAVDQIGSATRDIGDRVRKASDVLQEVMHGAQTAFEASERNTRQLVGALQSSVVEFKEVVDRYDVIDRTLGEAFDRIQSKVQASVGEMAEFNKRLNEEFAEALNRLEAVVAQTDPFDTTNAERERPPWQSS